MLSIAVKYKVLFVKIQKEFLNKALCIWNHKT